MFQKITLLMLSFLFFYKLSAQDSTFIKTYENYWTASTFIQNRSIHLIIKPLVGDRKQEIFYQPNVASTWGVGLIFKRLSLRVGLKLATRTNIKESLSRYFDIQVHSFGKKTIFDAYYQDYKGYYINNPKTVFTTWNLDKLPQREDLRIFYVGLNGTYIFNFKKFSYRAIVMHDEEQRKNAGSWLLTGSFNYTKIQADSSLIPPSTKIDFGANSHFNRANLYNLSLVPGYTYTLIIRKKFYLNGSLSMNLGLRYQQFGFNQLNNQNIVPSFTFLGRTSAGYNTDRFFMGLSFMVDAQTARLAETQTGTTTLNTVILLGYRFPTKLLKNYKSIWQWLFH